MAEIISLGPAPLRMLENEDEELPMLAREARNVRGQIIAGMSEQRERHRQRHTRPNRRSNRRVSLYGPPQPPSPSNSGPRWEAATRIGAHKIRAQPAADLSRSQSDGISSTISRDNTRGERSRQLRVLSRWDRSRRIRISAKESRAMSPASSSIADVMAAPSMRPEPTPPSSQLVMTAFNPSQHQSERKAPQKASSYWSVSESDSFPHLLRAFGTDWTAIAAHMGSKTAVMVRNYYIRQRVQGKTEWEDIIREAEDKKLRGEKRPEPPQPSPPPEADGSADDVNVFDFLDATGKEAPPTERVSQLRGHDQRPQRDTIWPWRAAGGRSWNT